jgi:hypothetical protein
MIIDIPDDWTPTAENINALPRPLRAFIHELSTRCDLTGELQELVLRRDQVHQLETRILELTGRATKKAPPGQAEGRNSV